MAELVYDSAQQRLIGFGKSWRVRSGIPGLFSPIPPGVYTAPPNALMTGNLNKAVGVPYHPNFDKISYEDKKGLKWFLWLGTGNYGIHPDGNVPGTKGCIGIVQDDTQDIFDLLKRYATNGLTVRVK